MSTNFPPRHGRPHAISASGDPQRQSPSAETDAQRQVTELTECLEDVLRLVALPTIWRGKNAQGILAGLGEILESAVRLEVFAGSVHVADSTIQTARLQRREAAHRAAEIHQWFSQLSCTTAIVESVPCGELGTLTVVSEPLACAGARAQVFIGSPAADFPTFRESVIIKTAVALATFALETASALDQREAALRAKDEFLAVLGHELRNPLAPIVSALDLMQARKHGVTSREESIMRRQLEHMGRLVDDLLDISRISRGLLILQTAPIELRTVVDEALEATSALFQANRQDLSIRVPESGLLVDADRVRLAQVIANLLSNASKYTPPQGKISVEAKLEHHQISLTVSDDGRGIAPELLARIFDKFVQGRSNSEAQFGGLGLGLSIVKTLVELHGGSVAAASEGVGRGSTFTVLLPLADADAGAISRPDVPPFAPQTRVVGKVVIVDDNVDAAEMLGELVALSGYQVRVEHDVRRAIAVIEDFEPDVAVLDLAMPDVSGFDLAALIRSKMADPPALIALTGYGQPSDRRRTEAAGFAAHLVKPVDMRALLSLLETMVDGNTRRAARSGSIR
jgi:signal transduction histidine kinase/ActR/RegA family two-component response regulator